MLTRRDLAAGVPAIAVAATAGEAGAAEPASGAPAESAEAARFRSIWEPEWAWREAQYPDDDDETKPLAPYLPDEGATAQAARLARWRDVLKALAGVDPARLGPEAQVDFAVYKGQVEALEASQAFRDFEAPANSDSAFWSGVTWVAQRSFHGEADYEGYIARLGQTPRYFDQQIGNMRSGLARGFTPPRVTMQGRDASAVAVGEAASPQATPFWKPFTAMPEGIPAARQAELRKAGAAAIAGAVIPAHRTLTAFLRETYIPGCRRTIAAADLPDGPAWYRSKIREFTTLDLAPDEIHRIGLAESAKIRAEMEAAKQEAGFTGDFPAFLAFLRSDPQFYAKTPQGLLNRAAWTCKVFDGKAKDWFGRLPRGRFAIKPVPAEFAPTYTAGRGGLNSYLLNTYDLPSRPLYALTALTLHESAPGHAFQIPLARELPGQPPFRRKGYISAYGEGWAVYCERLGEEMGMYETPYERFGMLSYQAWRAARLVVDTGVHAGGWSREQALAFVAEHTALPRREVTTEVDRYISWPGQALSYYLGMMAIANARAKATAALGAKLDIRAFHDTVLQLGSVPLGVVEARIDRFIAEGGPSPWPKEEA